MAGPFRRTPDSIRRRDLAMARGIEPHEPGDAKRAVGAERFKALADIAQIANLDNHVLRQLTLDVEHELVGVRRSPVVGICKGVGPEYIGHSARDGSEGVVPVQVWKIGPGFGACLCLQDEHFRNFFCQPHPRMARVP